MFADVSEESLIFIDFACFFLIVFVILPIFVVIITVVVGAAVVVTIATKTGLGRASRGPVVASRGRVVGPRNSPAQRVGGPPE